MNWVRPTSCEGQYALDQSCADPTGLGVAFLDKMLGVALKLSKRKVHMLLDCRTDRNRSEISADCTVGTVSPVGRAKTTDHKCEHYDLNI